MKPLDKFTRAWPWPTFKVTGGHFGPELVNTLVREPHELQPSNSQHRLLIWSPWTSSLMHDLDLLSRSLAAILFPSVTLMCLVNTVVWEWLQLETPNRVCRHLLWRPWTSLIMPWSTFKLAGDRLFPSLTLLCLVSCVNTKNLNRVGSDLVVGRIWCKHANSGRNRFSCSNLSLRSNQIRTVLFRFSGLCEQFFFKSKMGSHTVYIARWQDHRLSS